MDNVKVISWNPSQAEHCGESPVDSSKCVNMPYIDENGNFLLVFDETNGETSYQLSG